MSEAIANHSESLQGTVAFIAYRNPTNGYTVFHITTEAKEEKITVVGNVAEIQVGAHIIAHGAFVDHAKFGRQFSAGQISETTPSTAPGLIRFLSSGTIDGIGKRTAERVVEALGADAIKIIAEDPERVANIEGVGKHRAELLHEALKETSVKGETIRFLIEQGISPLLSGKIFERFKGDTLALLKKDPYILAREVRGIGFLTADGIATRMGMERDAPQRIKAGLIYALEQSLEDGHCYLTHQKLVANAARLLGCDNIDLVDDALSDLVTEGYLILREDSYYLPVIDDAEHFVASWIVDRIKVKDLKPLEPNLVENAISRAESELKVSLSPEQRLAVQYVAKKNLVIITGGPGCGKTTIIRALSLLCQEAHLSFALAAPTGRAAQRMASVCGAPASTVHRLLRFDPHRNSFVHGMKEPLPFDVIIVDETSMLDIMLARDLLRSIEPKTKLILVGDKDQLPSVGPGRVFADFISCRELPIVPLSKLFRRGEESRITTIAHTINAGRAPQIPEPDGETKSDAYFIERKTPREAHSLIESLVAEQIPKKFGIGNDRIAVLSPSNRGPLGTIEMNLRLQAKLNPRTSETGDRVLKSGNHELRIGDRVCQRVNNYKIHDAGVFNGDNGVIVGIDPSSLTATVELWDGRLIHYDSSTLGQLALAYCTTVHRSQGMEIPCVVLILDTGHYTLLERQLLYTAVTRAKELLIIVGSKKALMTGINKTSAEKRLTQLPIRIRELLGA